MRLKHLAIALLATGAFAAQGFAQPATAPTARPAPPVAPSTRPMPPPTTAPAAPTVSSPPATQAQAANTAMTNINTASAVELDKLPQIGKARAASIIKNRPYKTTDELVSKKAIPAGVYNKIKDRITAS